MTWNNTFLDAVTAAAGQTPGPLLVPWPMPGNLGVRIPTKAATYSNLIAATLPT